MAHDECWCSKGMAPQLVFAAVVSTVLLIGGSAIAQDDEDDKQASSGLSNLYIDLRTNYAYVPGGTLSIGLGGTSLFATLSQLATFQKQFDAPALPARPPFSPSTVQGVGVDIPLTVELGEALSLYGGLTGSTSYNGLSGWSDLAVTSWFLGFEVDLHQQNGGALPNLTLQSTLTRTVPDSPLATTSLNAILEAKYALDAEEMRGWLVGIQHTHVDVDSSLARVGSATTGYVGGFYQWENNWKVTARLGIQSFAGAQLLAIASIPSYTQPLIRLDLDRMDDDDNRLFGITAQIGWAPKPLYQLTVRTPLYVIKN